ncbi:LOW QUALITY PROTEIN: tetraspanin-16 [Neovison vison]|uniref:LOW QUALITY PROTEIN: tetraspanin-16 n=1 Tax=Neovison vison TaxID=452646 RepID=UPI001CF064E5|nr:LOW QUALITY PROTEIN: tetraspanin-16 [Neogale vison]
MDEMHTLYSSLKRLLSFFNDFRVMSGLILIDGLGIYVKFREAVLARVLGLSSAYLLNTDCLCPAVGCLTVLLGFVGWYGATRENRGTLLFCLLSTVTILIVEIIVVAVVLALFHIVPHWGHLAVLWAHNDEPDDCSTEWDLVMEKWKCRGEKNYTDLSVFSFEMTTDGYSCPRSRGKAIRTTACDGHNASTDITHQETITQTQSFSWSGGLLEAAVIQLPGILPRHCYLSNEADRAGGWRDT